LALTPLLGAPMMLAWLAAGIPWVLVLSSRGIRLPLGVVVATAMVFFLLLATLILTALLPVDPLWALSLVFAALGAVGAALTPEESLRLRRERITTGGVLIAIAPFTGAVVWLGARLLSVLLPQGSAVA